MGKKPMAFGPWRTCQWPRLFLANGHGPRVCCQWPRAFGRTCEWPRFFCPWLGSSCQHGFLPMHGFFADGRGFSPLTKPPSPQRPHRPPTHPIRPPLLYPLILSHLDWFEGRWGNNKHVVNKMSCFWAARDRREDGAGETRNMRLKTLGTLAVRVRKEEHEDTKLGFWTVLARKLQSAFDLLGRCTPFLTWLRGNWCPGQREVGVAGLAG